MKKHFLALLAIGAGACSQPMELESASSSQLTNMVEAMDRDARDIALANDTTTPTEAAAPVGGMVQLTDDQLTNQHNVFAFFFAQYYPRQCVESTPLPAGGTCVKAIPCVDPDPPVVMPVSRSVGTVTIETSLDSIRLEPYVGKDFVFYENVTRSGAFWRGDGDEVKLSLGGVEGSVPAFAHRAPAPVGDVIARLPSTPIDRTVPLRLRWDYADGAEAPGGVMMLQVYGLNGGRLNCHAPVANRAIEFPTEMMQTFAAGDGLVRMQSVATVNFGDEGTASAKNVKIRVTMSSRVDLGGADDQTANIAFR